MVTLTHEATFDSDIDSVWAIIGDPAGVPQWFTGVESATVVDGLRTCVLRRGPVVTERIVEIDNVSHRFSYSIVDGFPVTSHLGTVDLVEYGSGCRLLYTTQVTPDSFGDGLGRSIDVALTTLRELVDEPSR